MQLLIKNATLVFPGTSYNGQQADIFIKNGKVETFGPSLPDLPGFTLDIQGACISPGWLDIGTLTGDPGFEYREDLFSAAKAAAAGGFTAIACFPNTAPVLHSKAEIQYVKNHPAAKITEFLPVGAVSQDCKGKDITEMYDMYAAGAVAFSDGKKSIQDSGLMMRALLYAKPFEGVILNSPFDKNLVPGGQIHEGVMSTSLGLRGIPALAEELMLRRDLALLEYTGGRLHVHNVSTAGSVELIRQAKEKGLSVTASVAAMNIACDDHLLHDFDVNFKVLPPIREVADFMALQTGLKDGAIDVITSNHTPLDKESKNLEFPYAEFGAIGLESAFGLAWMHLHQHLSLSQMVEKLAVLPRKILRQPIAELKPGAQANFTLFDPDTEWTFGLQHIFSKSENTPFVGWRMKGKVLGTINKENVEIVRK